MYSFTVADSQQGREKAQGLVAEWLSAPALRSIVENAGGEWPASGELRDRVAQLHSFSERWDFRRGGERLAIRVEQLGLDERRLMTDAAELGMASASPPRLRHYDHALVMGGTALASINRVRRLAELRAAGLRVDRQTALTALRPVEDDERRIAASQEDFGTLVDGAEVEFDVLVAAFARYFGGKPQVERSDSDRTDVASARAIIDSSLVLAAPSEDSARRANSSDNYRVYTRRIRDGDRVLIVTSSVYLPYHHFLAVLGLGSQRPLTIDATGFPPEWMGGVLTGPHNVLQELRSGFFGALTLLDSVR